MAVTTPTRTVDAPDDRQGWEEPWSSFANWAAERLSLSLELAGGAYALGQRGEADTSAEPNPSGLGSSLFRRRRKTDEAEPSQQRYESLEQLGAALLARLAEQPRPPDLAPRQQPTSVRELAPALLEAYTIDGGGVHVAGCTFEDIPFTRVTHLVEGEPPGFHHTLLDRHGDTVDPALVRSLGLDDTTDLAYQPPGERGAVASTLGSPSGVVWARYVRGALQFTIGDLSFRTPFEGWAATLTAAPVPCPATGKPTHHLTSTDDHQIVAAEQVAECQASGRRLLQDSLVRCQVSGQLVAADLCEVCPVSGEPALREHFEPCPRCQQRVSRAALTARLCTACRTMRRVTTADPSLSAILGAYPALARLGAWRLAETSHAYLLQGGRLWRRRLFVLDRRTLAAERAFQLLPLGRVRELSPEERDAWLGG